MIPRYKDFCMGVKCGSNCLRHALKNSAPSSCIFEFANSFINMNISSGSLGAAALFTDLRYSSSTLCRFAERVSLLRRTMTNAAITSRKTHSPAPIHKRERTFIDLSYPLPGHQERKQVERPHRAQPCSQIVPNLRGACVVEAAAPSIVGRVTSVL